MDYTVVDIISHISYANFKIYLYVQSDLNGIVMLKRIVYILKDIYVYTCTCSWIIKVTV